MAYVSPWERERLAEQLASLSPEEIKTLRDGQLTKEQREVERQASLRLSDPLGTVRFYTGFDDEAILVRVGAGSGDEEDPLEWHVFTDYRTEDTEDHQLDHSKLSEPIVVLTVDQMRELDL